ncbi:TspO/MBR family protein [Bremerella sp. JC817]|uniref:TspO/MBR family protein n=1 Tax=Bremerella sp. JC817 TaxID=3231756 RepID=UPI00345AD523
MDANNPRTTPVWQQVVALAGWLVLCFAAAGVGSSFTLPQIGTWYAELNKPSFNPPNWIFGPVWSTLYLMMAIAAWLTWRKSGWSSAPFALILFCIQLLLNTAWSVLFFGLQNPVAAAFDIVLLWGAILATIIAFWPHSRVAALLLVPYLAWVSFASILNFTIVALN